MPFGFHLAMDTLPSGESFLRLTTHYRRLWIWRPSFERQRDFNPPEQRAAQRTLCPRLTSGDPSQHLSMSLALRQTTRSPRVLRTHLHAYARRIYVAVRRASIGLCIRVCRGLSAL